MIPFLPGNGMNIGQVRSGIRFRKGDSPKLFTPQGGEKAAFLDFVRPKPKDEIRTHQGLHRDIRTHAERTTGDLLNKQGIRHHIGRHPTDGFRIPNTKISKLTHFLDNVCRDLIFLIDLFRLWLDHPVHKFRNVVFEKLLIFS